ncbi:MAG: protein translocase subunit SecD [Parcubacteria group bacterium]|nr:protein translocase subunit SecD [Parcubacteria group bacterium]
MLWTRLSAVGVLFFSLLVGWFLFASEQASGGFFSRFPFKTGLDLSGGTHLVYRADINALASGDVTASMESLRDVIERRVNLFGVAEPNVQTERTAGFISDEKEYRLIVELPGVTDIDRAVDMIGQTPVLEFKLARGEGENASFEPTGLTGRFVKRASVGFNGTTGEPLVLLGFTSEGADLFARITRDHTGEVLAIFLDGAPISLPVIQEEIRGGDAEITGRFTPEEAKTLVGRLNAGALPVPIELLGSQTIGASLGASVKDQGIKAGVAGLLAVGLFMILWYRAPGLIAVLALLSYVVLMLSLFKLIPVTLTAAGIAGFILSVGMAVDANVLIFERLKEELRGGTPLPDAIRNGFDRAWQAIRDANVTSIISAVILFWFGTSIVKGFALVFGLGVLVSMITAVTVTRVLLRALAGSQTTGGVFFGSGFRLRPENAKTPAS